MKKMFSLCLLTRKSNRKTSYSVILRVRFSRFSSAIFNTFALYASVFFEQNSPWEESGICRLLPNTFQIFKVFLVYFWSPNLWLDPTNHIFHQKATTTNLKSCTELDKVINTRNFVEKKLPDISGFSWKNREFKYSQKLNEVYSHKI